MNARSGSIFSRSLFAILAGTSAASAHATEPPATNEGELDQIIVTARSSRAEILTDVPDSITAFNSAAIERADINEIYDVARLTPGLSLVESSQSPGIALINIRGIGQQLNQEPPVAVVIDGVQVASPAAITQSLIDVERIEVLKGPQGALYGRNAIGGALNIVTREPADAFKGYAQAGLGTHGTYRFEGALSGAVVPSSVRVKLSGYYSDFDGDFSNQVINRQTNPYRDWLISGRSIADIANNFSIDLRGSYSESRNAGYNAVVLPGGNAGDFSAQPVSGHPGFGFRSVGEASALLKWTTSAGILSSVTAYVDSRDESGYDLDQQPVDLIDLDLQRTDVKAISEELRLTSNGDQPLRYTVGAYLLWTDLDRVTQVTLFPPVTGAPVPVSLMTDASQDNFAWALFGQINYDLSSSLELTLAGRYDRDRRKQVDNLASLRQQATFNRFQPKASIAFKPQDGLNFYATYAEGFRSGGFNQPSPSFPSVYDQEETTSVEGGVKSELFDRRLRVSAAVFHIVQKGQQVTLVDVQNSGTQGIVNIDRTRFTGAEGELTANIGSGLSVSGGVTYIDSRITQFARAPQFVGNRSPYTPEWSVTAMIDYSTELAQDLSLSLHADYGGKSGLYYEYFGSVKQPAYGLVNLRVALQHQDWRIEAFGENIFDKNYYSDVASNFVTGGLGDLGIRGRGSRFGGRVRVDF